MCASESSGGIVSLTEIAELADLFDQSEFAFDPTSDESKEAAVTLESRVREIYEERIQPYHKGLSLYQFRCAIRTECRQYVRKNL